MHDFHEGARLGALHQLKLLDTPPNESFDRITRLASQIFGLPVAAVSLTDCDRQWFKSRVGVDHSGIPRKGAPCAQVAEEGRVVVIEDLQKSPDYAESVLGQAGTRFYAGAPLVTSDGYGLGALCVLGAQPRQATASELAALVDLAAMVMAQIELQHAFGRVDPVSGMPTKSQFCDDLIDLARDHPGQRRFAVVVELARDDQINRISRVLGAPRVDDLVREASQSIQTALGPTRKAYHISAAQFAFLSPPDVDEATYIALLKLTFDRLRSTSSMRFVTTVAIGVRPFTTGTVPADDVLRGAVSALQDARKSDGAIALYSPSNDSAHRRQYDLLRDFGIALGAKDQLHMMYQPRIDLATGDCIGAEALLRWRHPVLGNISPTEFIPVIEQTCLAQLTTEWVLDEALDQLTRWAGIGFLTTVSVNISAVNLGHPDFIQHVQLGLLKRTIHPDRLEIELTESAIMEQPAEAIAMLRELAEAGIGLAIDDFGTGHSSLAYLQKLPARVLKIDQTFVRCLVSSSGPDFVLVQSMIELGHKLGFRIVAEGVETQAAADILRFIGCEEAQGFWFAPAMDGVEFTRWLGRREANLTPAPVRSSRLGL